MTRSRRSNLSFIRAAPHCPFALSAASRKPEDACMIAEDGTYRIGSKTGRWKAENQLLHLRQRGRLTWILLARHRLDGDTLVLSVLNRETDLIWKRD